MMPRTRVPMGLAAAVQPVLTVVRERHWQRALNLGVDSEATLNNIV